MKVLWITANFFPLMGGLEVYTERAVTSLAAHCDVRLITPPGQKLSADAEVSHVTVPDLGTPESQAHWEQACRLIHQQSEEFEPDVVHFANAGIAVYRNAIPRGVPVIATVHGNDLTAPWQRVPGEDTSARILASLNGCDHIIAVSHHTAALVEQFHVEAPVTILTAGCDTAFFRPLPAMDGTLRQRLGIKNDHPIVLTVGRLVARKGHQHILAAICSLGVDVHWVVVGDGPMRDSLPRMVLSSRVADRVTLTGKVSSEILLQLYNACSFFVLTPDERRSDQYIDSEGFGLVFQEAGACGKAVIASETAGCCDAVIDGATGLLVAPGDVATLASAMRSLLENPSLSRELGGNALSFVRASGGWERFARQTLDLYRDVIARAS